MLKSNDVHLITQVPNVIDIATNECKNFNKYENKDNIDIEVDNPDEIIYNFITENKLNFEKI